MQGNSPGLPVSHVAIETAATVTTISTTRFSEISSARQRLVRLCEAIGFGCIENLVVQNAEPLISTDEPVIHLDIKLDRPLGGPPKKESVDFQLQAEFARLMSLLDAIQNGCIAKIEVRDGVPRRILCAQRFQDGFMTLKSLASYLG
jgi:hypothetical protein